MATPTWRQFLENHNGGDYPLFEKAFVDGWGEREWLPNDDDRDAAAKLHTQIISRITTQRLGYLDGDEKTALDSVYILFGETRKLCDLHFKGRQFEVLAWHVLNTHVRPFTAKWHLQSKRGMLSALDSTDEFRAELEQLQQRLKRFEILLASLRDDKMAPALPDLGDGPREDSITEEMGRDVGWGIPNVQGGIDEKFRANINSKEGKAIADRREEYKDFYAKPKKHVTALALSGGGIRSATFSLGVLVALARRGLLPQFDYLSTVSGGGYLGSFLTAYLNAEPEEDPPATSAPAPDSKKQSKIGLRANELPFQREAGEAEALRHIRHHSKYLAAGSFLDRLRMLAAQIYGMVLNGFSVVFLAAVFALAEYYIRECRLVESAWTNVTALLAPILPAWTTELWKTPVHFLASAFVAWAIISLYLIREGRTRQRIADNGLVFLGGLLLFSFLWIGLDSCHPRPGAKLQWPVLSEKTLLPILGAIPVIASAFAGIAGKIFDRVKMVLGVLSAFAAPLFLFGLYLLIYQHAGETWVPWVTAVAAFVYLVILNVNFTSPHRYYRKKLAQAYLIQPAKNRAPGHPFDGAVRMKLSEAGAKTHRAPYHLINAALNVPGSKNPGMQGRLTDFFLFSPAFCGSPLTGYQGTKEWEAKDGHLDLGTAMAISGAAAAPQMGLGTRKRLSFWLALLNVRLGYWVRKPRRADQTWHDKIASVLYGGAPGLSFLVREMRGSMDECKPWLYLSDGGHIENLGVYELLRRRCKYIVAVDGEQDERMTFGALTTLQRLAAIDLGVKIDINLDDLRLNEQGLSRSHFRFCRIEYPGLEYGYLLYVKLSLTGNEGEFLRRYRLDEPDFPHHSTADQFFSEAQFEAYRSLGEHVGDKIFLRALVGEELARAPSNERPFVPVEDLFLELGKRLLKPLPAKL